MSEWHYAKGGQKHGPLSFEEIRRLAGSGELAPDDLVWTDGMDQWAPARSVQGLAVAAAAPQASDPPDAAMAQPALEYYSPVAQGGATPSRKGLDMLRQTKPWVRLLAILMFLSGGLTLVGAVVATISIYSSPFSGTLDKIVPLLLLVASSTSIAPAVYLNRYASLIGAFLASHQDRDLEAALEAQKAFWRLLGFMTIAGVVGMFLVPVLTNYLR
jgi:hypothetical protein